MGWVERFMAILAGIGVVAAVSVLVARSEVPVLRSRATVSVETGRPIATKPAPTARPATPKPTLAPKVATNAGAITTTHNVRLRKGPSMTAKSKGIIPPGVLAPVLEKRGEFFEVFTPHEVQGWVHESKVRTHEKASRRPNSLNGATIVVDPGHGGHLPGAKGFHGLLEKDVNLDLSKRLEGRLQGARVIMTRNQGHAGLAYRSTLANRLGAHAFISMHNNALPDTLSKHPGTEVYHQRQSKDSKRLAGLIYEELYTVFKKIKIQWGRDPFAGAKYRISHEHGGEYYAVLRRTKVPAVIVEGMFITNPSEEKLLRQAKVRQMYADAVARGVKRYFTTNDTGSGFKDPYAKPTPQCPIPGCFEHRK